MIYHDKLSMAFLEKSSLTKSNMYKILDLINAQFAIISFYETHNEDDKTVIRIYLEQLEVLIEEDCILIDFIGNMELSFKIILLLKKSLFSDNSNIQLFEESYTIIVDLENKTSLFDLKKKFGIID